MITIIRTSADELQRSVWKFNYIQQNDIVVRLSSYSLEMRKTKRHGWKSAEYFDNYNSRNCTIEKSAVYLPPDVIEEAKAIIYSKIVFQEL